MGATDDNVSPHTPSLEYGAPSPRQRTRWTGVRRLALALSLSVLHWCAGFCLVGIFSNTRFINAAVLLFLFPFGWIAMRVNPHRMAEAAMGNSIFCAFAIAYAVTAWLNRRDKAE